MKISKMSTDQAADVLVRIAEPVTAIMDDSRVIDILKEISEMKNVPYIKVFVSLVPKIVPLALETHRDDLFEIVGALDNKTVADVKSQNILKTIKVFQESIDKDLIDFFGSIGSQEKTAENE